MNLSSALLPLLQDSCAGVFAQRRTRARAVQLAVGSLCSFGRRTISRAVCAVGRQDQDWSADYKLYSRSPWSSQRLFDPVLRQYLKDFPQGPIRAAMDDTKLRRAGRRVKTAFWQRDPLSPPFHVNLLHGLRFMQTSLLLPHYQQGNFSARAHPVRFTECPAVKKPGKRATEEERAAYRQARKTRNLSRQGLEEIRGLRARLDELGAARRALLMAVDGSLCNRTIFREPLDQVHFIGRCRKDARLCWPAPAQSRRKYAAERFKPEQIRQNPAIAWRRRRLYFGGAWREIRYKEIKGVLWRRGAGKRPLRLLVLAPTPYRLSPAARINYREPAYLLCTDLESSVQTLLQVYLDRWQIEVNHRDEKDILGVGQAQVWSERSVARQPAFAVAAYSLLLLAGLKAFGPGRSEHFVALPRWRKRARRASALDLITLLRKEINETSVGDAIHPVITRNLVNYAYT
jgi:hypothetical protein